MIYFDEFDPMNGCWKHPEFSTERYKDPCTGNDMIKVNYHCLENFARDVADSLPRIFYYPSYQSNDTIPRAKNLLIQFEKSFKSMTKNEVYQSIIDSFKIINKEEVIRWNSMRILSKWKQGT